jgi:hypothetical protein
LLNDAGSGPSVALNGGDKLQSVGYDPASDLVLPTLTDVFGLNGGPKNPTESRSIMKVRGRCYKTFFFVTDDKANCRILSSMVRTFFTWKMMLKYFLHTIHGR